MTSLDNPWSIDDPRELYRVAGWGDDYQSSAVHVTRLAPGDACVTVDWHDYGNAQHAREIQYRLVCRLKDDGTIVSELRATGPGGSVVVRGLNNGVDYELQLFALDAQTDEEVDRSPVRLVRSGLVPGTVINYVHPEDYIYGFSGRSTASPSIVRLPDGRLAASHDLYWQKGGQNLSLIFDSEDDGRTWRFVTFLYPCFWGKLFVHEGALYMLAMSTEYGALLIGRSDNGGRTWSVPSVLMPAGNREEGGPHKAPMPIVPFKGRLWTAIDYGTWSNAGRHDSGVISVPADSNLLDPSNWVASPFLPYNPHWPGTVEGGRGLLEGNAVVTPGGELINLLRYQTSGGTPNYGRAIMLNVDSERPDAPLTFRKVIDFHGNLSKFFILYDDRSRLYWSLVNRVTSDNVFQRNLLSLVWSDDLEHWSIARDVLDYEHNDWPEDNTKVGFQYVEWFFEGDDILLACRTAINGAYNYHNANHITYHRIEQFRNRPERP